MQLMIAHADLNRVLQHVRDGESARLADYFAGLIERLSHAGATAAAVSAVTPHFCFNELIPRSALPLVSITDVTAREVQSRNLRRVALLGTRFVIETNLFQSLGDVEVVPPLPHETDAIHEAYLDIVNKGQGTENHYVRLSRIATEISKREGLDAVILAGTELSLVFSENAVAFPIVDCTDLHLKAIMSRMEV